MIWLSEQRWPRLEIINGWKKTSFLKLVCRQVSHRFMVNGFASFIYVRSVKCAPTSSFLHKRPTAGGILTIRGVKQSKKTLQNAFNKDRRVQVLRSNVKRQAIGAEKKHKRFIISDKKAQIRLHCLNGAFRATSWMFLESNIAKFASLCFSLNWINTKLQPSNCWFIM